MLTKKYGTAAELPVEKQKFHALKHSVGTLTFCTSQDRELATGYKVLPDSLETGRLPLQNCRLVDGPQGEDRLIGEAGPGGLAS